MDKAKIVSLLQNKDIYRILNDCIIGEATGIIEETEETEATETTDPTDPTDPPSQCRICLDKISIIQNEKLNDAIENLLCIFITDLINFIKYTLNVLKNDKKKIIEYILSRYPPNILFEFICEENLIQNITEIIQISPISVDAIFISTAKRIINGVVCGYIEELIEEFKCSVDRVKQFLFENIGNIIETINFKQNIPKGDIVSLINYLKLNCRKGEIIVIVRNVGLFSIIKQEFIIIETFICDYVVDILENLNKIKDLLVKKCPEITCPSGQACRDIGGFICNETGSEGDFVCASSGTCLTIPIWVYIVIGILFFLLLVSLAFGIYYFSKVRSDTADGLDVDDKPTRDKQTI
jgi:hypothetical protein